MKLNTSILLLLCLAALGGSAQDLKLKARINGSFNLMMTDHIGKLYLGVEDELFMYSKEGKLLYQYSDLSSGEITYLDTRNPLKLLLFYPDYSQITYLDNTLSHSRENAIQLDRLNLELVQLVCASFDNGFWVYDPVDFRLIRFDQGLNVTNEEPNINQLVGAELNPIQMVEGESWLYLNDPQHGIFVFDQFGMYAKLIPIKGIRHFQVRGNGIFLHIETGLMKYNMITLEQEKVELPIKDFQFMRIEKDLLYFLTDSGVHIYSSTD